MIPAAASYLCALEEQLFCKRRPFMIVRPTSIDILARQIQVN